MVLPIKCPFFLKYCFSPAPRASVIGAVSADAIDRQKNPSLDEVKPLEAFDAVIHALGRWKIAVVLNNHTSHLPNKI